MKKTIRKLINSLLIAVVMAALSGNIKPEHVEAADSSLITQNTTKEYMCDNIFYPLGMDNQWTYKLDAQIGDYIGHEKQDFTTEATLAVAEINETDILLNQLDNEKEIINQSHVQYDDQAIVMFPLIEMNMIIGDMANSLDFEHVSGEFMPSEKDFTDNDWSLKWETEYEVSGILEANYEGKSFKAVFSESPVKMSWEVINTDNSLEVSAGSFDNLVKINREIKVDVTSLNAEIKGKQVNVGTTLIIDSDLYYAAEIGLIKETINKASIKVFGIKLPIEVQGSIDLASYSLN